MKKILTRILSLTMAGMLLCGSAAAEPALFTTEMAKQAVLSVGNTQRIQRAIEKARSGEEVSIVYLGGSITEGALASPQPTHCYAYLSAQLFAEKFMPDAAQLRYTNAGISGTPSLLGITRVEQDVLSRKPDIVFVEFAVNDGTDPQSQMAYESLVRRLLHSESQPAVVLIFTILSGGYSAKVHMRQVGKHYQLGMVSVADVIQIELMRKSFEWSDYSSDYAHPNNAGHAFIADMIGHYFDQAAATPAEEYVIPEDAIYSGALENLQNLGPQDAAITDPGSFSYGAVSCYSYKNGWRYRPGDQAPQPMTFSVTASHLTFVVKQEKNQNCGSAEVWVDGECKATLSCYGDGAWGNPVTTLVDLGDTALHTVELRIVSGDEGKNFNLLDVGYAAK